MSGILSAPTQLIGEVFALIYRGAPGHETHVTPAATLALSGDPGDFWLNSAVISDGNDAESALRHAAATLRERSLPGWLLHDETLTERLAPIARSVELDDGGSAPFMVFHPEQAPPPLQPDGDIVVDQVLDAAELREANRITAAAFGSPEEAINRVWRPLLLETPGLEIFLGRRDGAAISVVMTMRHGSVTGIWTMGTLPDHQRTGAGRALLSTVIRRHLERGATAFYLIAFEAGKRLYDQLGFHTESEIHMWIDPGPSDQGHS